MKCKLLVLSLSASLFVSFFNVQAQVSQVEISSKYNPDKTVDLDYVKKDPGNYTVVLKFKELTNTNSPYDHVLNVNDYSGKALRLRPSDAEQNIRYSYSYSYIRGKLKPKYNPDFIYTLPYQSGEKVNVSEAYFVKDRYFGSTTPDDWKVYHFYTENEATVTAARKGIVVEIKDEHDDKRLETVEYSSSVDQLMIEHADGTLARYGGFKKGSFKVEVGEVVFPGTPLGINVKMRSNNKHSISFTIMYLQSSDIESTRGQSFKDYKSLYGFVTPRFYTAEDPNSILVARQVYTATDSPELIKREMTKKEQKKLAK